MVINCLENKKKQSEKVMGTIKGIPYGMSNFEDVITQNRYYVDKTMYPHVGRSSQLSDIHPSETLWQEPATKHASFIL